MGGDEGLGLPNLFPTAGEGRLPPNPLLTPGQEEMREILRGPQKRV